MTDRKLVRLVEWLPFSVFCAILLGLLWAVATPHEFRLMLEILGGSGVLATIAAVAFR